MSTAGQNPGQNSHKTTGWKIPLLFCAAVALIVGGATLWRQMQEPQVPALEAGLLQEAQTLHIDLEADEWGRAFKEALTESAAGFSGRELKDTKVERLARDAIEAGRFDAACAASILIRHDRKRDGFLMDMTRRAAQDCATLPWGAFAARGMLESDMQTSAHLLLNGRWCECSAQTMPR